MPSAREAESKVGKNSRGSAACIYNDYNYARARYASMWAARAQTRTIIFVNAV